ncbi:lysophospholipid acyltransferase family protein [Xanthobacter sp. 126]|uniref:lysophospholipid acyltransferase family protein n=1 Tax=Xanthobacter sp. 126 TaxID=1131814 RepID=UPI00045E7D0C|nr:lysophospholipid acyltransferase family protein [Xanthobacter sp. 126]
MTFLRSLVFQIAFYAATTFYLLVFLPLLPFLSRRGLWRTCIMWWVATNVFFLRVIVGIRAEIRGIENIPEGPLLIASKHQSAWETFALLPLFSDPAFILKRELMSIPIFGWFAARVRMIPVDRKGGSAALKTMTRRAQADMAEGRQILIFPEGTRRPAGAPPDYKFGVAYLYSTLGVPCLPIALNSGLYWPRRTILKRPGTIRVEILPPIPPGLPRQKIMARLQADIEAASDRLLAEGLAELGPRAPANLRGRAGAQSSPLSTPVENS